MPTALQLAALAVAGYPVARSGIANLWINRSVSINLLMSIAAVGAVVIGDLGEAATLIFLFDVAEALEGYTTDRARRTLGELRSLAPTHALRLEGREENLVPVSALVVGNRILVRPGERIPIDGKVFSGSSEANQAPITGESLPVAKSPGDVVFAGSVNGSGSLKVQVTRLAEDTTLARIVRMVTEAQGRRAPVQRFIDRFAEIYTPAVVGVAILVAAVPPLLFGQPFLNPPGGTGWLYRAPGPAGDRLPLRAGDQRAGDHHQRHHLGRPPGRAGEGRRYLEALAGLRQLAFDKTGTLTRGAPAVTFNHSVELHARIRLHPANPLRGVRRRAGTGQRARDGAAPTRWHGRWCEAAEARGLAGRYAAAGDVRLNGRGLQGPVDGKLATVGNHALFEDHHPTRPSCAR